MSDHSPAPPHSDAETGRRPQEHIQAAKAQLRASALAILRAVPAAERAQASADACRILERKKVWQTATRVLVYAPLADELDIGPLVRDALREGKTVALPKYDPQTRCYSARQIRVSLEEMRPGRFGIREPDLASTSVSMLQLDLVLVPGLAFDLHGHRLGRGRGYYDRLLAGTPATKCGLALDQQVQVQIPVEAHDILLDCILTPTRWLEFRQLRHGDDVLG